jgi:hypothetical protein
VQARGRWEKTALTEAREMTPWRFRIAWMAACIVLASALSPAEAQKPDESVIALQRQLADLDKELSNLERQRQVWQALSDDLSGALQGIKAVEPREFEEAVRALTARFKEFEAERDQGKRQRLGADIVRAIQRLEQIYYEPIGSAQRFLGVFERPADDAESRLRRRHLQEVMDRLNRLTDEEPVFRETREVVLAIGGVGPFGPGPDPQAQLRTTAITQQNVNKVLAVATPANIGSVREKVRAILNQAKTAADARVNELNGQIEAKKKQSIDILTKIEGKQAGQRGIDQLLIYVALPIFGVLVIALMVIPLMYRNPALQHLIFESGILLELITVFLLTTTILLLGIGGKIEKEVLGTLLGGISGYVLGRSLRLNRPPQTPPPPPPPAGGGPAN